MKETLFRGKTLPKENQDFEFNNVWVYGDLIIDKTTGKYYIHPQYNTFKTENEIAKTMVVHEVVPNTIGQFTGLCDKNGYRIFEGDIVKEWSNHWKTPLKTEINIYKVVCEYLGSLHLIRKTEYGENSTPLYQRSVVEVIGNIYDSPELLEEL